MTRSICVDAPVGTVWSTLSDLESIQLWVPAIQRAYCPGRRRGAGAVRVCELRRGAVRETILDWDEGRSFTYRGEGAPMLKSATNRWSIEPHGESQTLVTTTAEASLAGGPFGVVLETLMKPLFMRMGARSLASLKYLVEHGEPFSGDEGDLPLGSPAC